MINNSFIPLQKQQKEKQTKFTKKKLDSKACKYAFTAQLLVGNTNSHFNLYLCV